jgi:hypothetical protein
MIEVCDKSGSMGKDKDKSIPGIFGSSQIDSSITTLAVEAEMS